MYEEERGTPLEPQIEILELDKDQIKFILHNADLSVANALRRIIIAEVPTMAIEFVNVKVNTSVMNDEYIAQRLGLIPLTSSNIDQFNYPHEGGTDSIAMNVVTSVKYTLRVRNDGTEPIEVTSQHLKPDEENETEDQKSVKPVVYTNNNGEQRHVLIMKLAENQELDLDCIAQKGQGKLHSKWSPVSLCNMQYEPKIDINYTKMAYLNSTQKKQFVESCPKKVYSYNSKSGQVEIENASACIFCEECTKTAHEMQAPELVKISHTQNKFLFTVESNGSLKPDEIIDSALSQLQQKLDTVEDAMKTMHVGKNRR